MAASSFGTSSWTRRITSQVMYTEPYFALLHRHPGYISVLIRLPDEFQVAGRSSAESRSSGDQKGIGLRAIRAPSLI